ncbi:uncharacterized protein PV09_00975 [Verruconis gallopava]|uniref:CENP-V/GFA domain-containing protein n=1 Tax=Verruconis gallopava TaxID=253628 RepID=A0A0D1XZ36_9PEZI|nr:uncharacterized protein PV09_00975 [Verruconis gallopava]KIW08031.1 hypothetical protein PV09_00975 [Verruconis gallopava]
MAEDRTIRLACHCGKHKYSFTVPVSSLPIKQRLCHCNISRRISGCLFTSYFAIPASNPPPDLTGLTEYKSSDILSRYFCSTCSTHLYCRYNDDGHFEASHGSVDGSTDDIFDFRAHGWIEDTKDGGASVWLKEYKGSPLSRWLIEWNQSPEVPLNWTSDHIEPTNKVSEQADEKLRVHCHCNGVEFFISRPSEDSFKASSPLPDLLVPYNSGQSAQNPENKPWWLSTDHTKYLAGNCACRSCRMTTGFDIQQWAFIPAAGLSLANGKPFNLPFGTLRSYESSTKPQRRIRWSCSRCGATVLWTGEERPTLIDVAAGLLDAPSGARAEEWLQWDLADRVSFKEDAHNTHLADALEKGLVQWYIK